MRNVRCYYVVGRVNGKIIFYGPYRSENDALNKSNGIQDWDTYPEIFACDSIDMARAKSMWKAKQADKTGLMGQAMLKIKSGRTETHNRQEREYEV